MRLLTCLGLCMFSAMFTYASDTPEPILPGVWKIRLGSPEKLTPLKYRTKSPAKDGFSSLPSVPQFPLQPDEIGFETTPRGCVVSLPFSKSERFYGLGMSTNTFELAGRKAWVVPSDHPEETTNESHGPEPFFVSSHGYGVYFDTARYAAVSFGNSYLKGGEMNVEAEIPTAHGVDVYVFAGPSMREAVQRYNLFSGGGPLPPLWGLGIAYRGKGDFSAADILQLSKSFRDTDMPCDIFGVEPGWQTQTYSSTFVWNTAKFPDPGDFIAQMHAMDFRISMWEHPFTHPTSPIHEALIPYSGDHQVWGGLVPDFATEQGRKVFVGWQDKVLFSKGVDSVKIDEVDNQPFKPDPWSFPDFSKFPSGLDGEQMHSLIGVLEQQAMLAPLKAKNLRTWGLVRDSGALAAPLPYTLYSDTYDHTCYLRGLTKIGFGGHMWVPEVRDAKSVADLVRRVQTVIFSPYAMINCWYMKMPPWLQIDAGKANAGEQMPEAAEATGYVRSAFKLRMSLIPYLYSAFNDYHQTGLPPLRALVLDYPDDPETVKIDNQFMFGPSLMAAPMVDGVSKRSVYFPSGDWYDFFTGEKIAGGRRVEVSKGLDQMPLYVKGDCLLPLAEPVNHVGKDTTFKIHVRVYGSHPAPFTLYEDDGETFDFEQGDQSQVVLSWDGAKGSSKRSGTYTPIRNEILNWEPMGS
ncbi:MAG TPA: TIM-barrel domain-containing protein [Fimbriimonadaceae bacterium]